MMKLSAAALAAAIVSINGVAADAPKSASCVGPDCKTCEGLGGVIPYGGTKDDIVVPDCEVMYTPEDIKKQGIRVPPPVYPKEYRVNVTGSYSSRALARPRDTNYYHLDCVYTYSAEKNALHFVNVQHINDAKDPYNADKMTSKTVEGLHVGATLATIDRFGLPFQKEPTEVCYCLNYTIKGEAVSPVSWDSFVDGSMYLGREKLMVEYGETTGFGEATPRVVDHYQKSFYHFWFDVETGKPVRSLNRQRDDYILSVYYGWEAKANDAFALPGACGAWWQTPWNNCKKLIDEEHDEKTEKDVAGDEKTEKDVAVLRPVSFTKAKDATSNSKLRAMFQLSPERYNRIAAGVDDTDKVNPYSSVAASWMPGTTCDVVRKVEGSECGEACLDSKTGFCPRSMIMKAGHLEDGSCKDAGFAIEDGEEQICAGPCGTIEFKKYKKGTVLRGATPHSLGSCETVRKVVGAECAQTCLGDTLGLCPRDLIISAGGLDTGSCKSVGFTAPDGKMSKQAGPCGSLTFDQYKKGSAASTSGTSSTSISKVEVEVDQAIYV